MGSDTNTRSSGILLPIFSLPSKYGQGCFSQDAFDFLDFLSEAGQKYWQILPLEPVGDDNSPYQPAGCFAANPAFLDPDTLMAQGLLTQTDMDSYLEEISPALEEQKETGRIAYQKLKPAQAKLRHTAYLRFAFQQETDPDPGFKSFCDSNAWWLRDYALFLVLMKKFESQPWANWPEEYKNRDEKALAEIEQEFAEEIRQTKWEQYEFRREWKKIHDYASHLGIQIIGDLPIYAAQESSDCWAQPELFLLDENRQPTAVAGCPPDDFAADGQLWNNPIYNWEGEKKKVYFWWFNRFREKFTWYDSIRIDHFRGFESYFSIPADTKKPGDGVWMKGPGLDFFQKLRQAVGDREFIAEDLGYITPEVRQLITDTGFPGMKVLQFAFGSDMENLYLPHNFDPNCVVFTGTHDNNTTRGWFDEASDYVKTFCRWYLMDYFAKSQDHPAVQSLSPDTFQRWTTGSIQDEEIPDAMILMAEMSLANQCILPMQDLLGLGSEARNNVPSVASGNWSWQLSAENLTPELAKRLHALTDRTGRL